MIVRLSACRAFYAHFDPAHRWVNTGLFQVHPGEIAVIFPSISVTVRHELDQTGFPTCWSLCFMRGVFGWMGVIEGEVVWSSLDEPSNL